MPADPDDTLTLIVSAAELALLRKLDFPCSEPVLASAHPTDEGIALHGTRAKLESLAGWVAGEANHARAGTRRSELLYGLAEQIEDVLTVYWR
jgi:hypothetical protein